MVSLVGTQYPADVLPGHERFCPQQFRSRSSVRAGRHRPRSWLGRTRAVLEVVQSRRTDHNRGMIRCYVTDRTQGDILSSSARAVHEGVDLIQVREKDLAASELLRLTTQIRDLAAGTKTRVLVNDRLDVALAAHVDGLHLPGYGMAPERVRPLVKVLSVSTHTIAEAIAAEKARADFILFGPIFDTPGKNAVGLEPLRAVVAAVRIPVLAIGGITSSAEDQVLATGAAGIAGIRMFQID